MQEIIFNVSNHPIYGFLRKAKLKDLTFNNQPNQQILFKLEVVNYTIDNEEEIEVEELTKSAQFIADSVSTISPPTPDIDLIMSRIMNNESFLTIVSDCITFLDLSGKLNERLGILIINE